MTPENETAADVFERINRRRAPVAETRAFEARGGRAGSPESAMGGLHREPADEVPFEAKTARAAHSVPRPTAPLTDPLPSPLFDPGVGSLGEPIDPLSGPVPDLLRDPLADPRAGTPADPVADRFPRSATMRLILKHPALALGLGLPAAGLLLKSPASRRLLGMAVRVGTGPELQTLIRLSESRREDPLR